MGNGWSEISKIKIFKIRRSNMERIINLIEAELKRQEQEIELLKWQIEDMKKQIEEKEEALAEYRGRRPFAEVLNEEALKNGPIR
jgi:cell division septum initiation protein DivIVA